MVGEQRLWFEDVPEDQRHWFLAQWGMPPGAEQTPDEMQEEALDPPSGVDPAEFREDQERGREYLRREEAAGYAPGALNPPWWTEIEGGWEHREEPEFVTAPQLYTTREHAEEALRQITDREPEDFLNLVERHGWVDVNEAFDNTSPLRVIWVDRETLAHSLEDAAFLCVKVDDRLKLRQDFIEELGSIG